MKKYGLKTSNSSSSPETWKNGLHYSHRNCKVLYQTLHHHQNNPAKGKKYQKTITKINKKYKNIKENENENGKKIRRQIITPKDIALEPSSAKSLGT